jgi:hypothetical protein
LGKIIIEIQEAASNIVTTLDHHYLNFITSVNETHNTLFKSLLSFESFNGTIVRLDLAPQNTMLSGSQHTSSTVYFLSHYNGAPADRPTSD